MGYIRTNTERITTVTKKIFKNTLPDDLLQKRTTPREIDIRGNYYRDQTAIIHSLPFRRMKKKTQVFFAPNNDHICTRIEHILHVTSVATTICKGLNLDVELAQSIALAHDLGHPPFGHVGEHVLNSLYKDKGTRFIHEINSYRIVEYMANRGKGLNLCYAVKDGIICHCGEKFEQHISPDFTIKNLDTITNRSHYPSTYEGCVVRVADKISYLGRDIEDAMRLGIVNEKNIDPRILQIPGVTFEKLKDSVNKLIINYLILDVINYSTEHGVIGFSEPAHTMMLIIKNFNYSTIYNSKTLKNYKYFVKKVIGIIYDSLFELFEKHGYEHEKYEKHFIKPFRDFARYIKSYKNFYQSANSNAHAIIVDYIAGMTDNFALDFCKKVSLPRRIF